MGAFQNNKYRSATHANTFPARYRAAMAKHPFLLFGLPFLAVIIGGSFVLTPATAIRYERYDRKVRQLSKEEELGVGKAGRRVNMREEYYVGLPFLCAGQRAVKRLPLTRFLVRKLRTRTWTTGSRSGLSGSRARTMAPYKGTANVKDREKPLTAPPRREPDASHSRAVPRGYVEDVPMANAAVGRQQPKGQQLGCSAGGCRASPVT